MRPSIQQELVRHFVAGVRQVNRTATSIAEWELAQAMDKRLGEGVDVRIGDASVAFRPVQAGYYLGSTHTVYGGVTELDFDLVSDGAEVSIAGVGGKARGYYIGIGLDIVVADSRSTEIVLARSYRKQIWGQELEANLFRFWDIGNGDGSDVGTFGGAELFDLRIGRQQNEPIHQSVRWVVELAAYEIVRDLAGIGASCQELVPTTSRSKPSETALAAPGRSRTAAIAPAPAQTTPAPVESAPAEGATKAPQPLADRPTGPAALVTDEPTGSEAIDEAIASKAIAPSSTDSAGRRVVRLPNGRTLEVQGRD